MKPIQHHVANRQLCTKSAPVGVDMAMHSSDSFLKAIYIIAQWLRNTDQGNDLHQLNVSTKAVINQMQMIMK